MKCYDETKSLYIETDTSGVVLGAALLQTRSNTSSPMDEAPDNSILRLIAFARKSLTSTENRYRNIEREELGILYRLKKFYHYCFVRDVNVITDHNLLVATLKNRGHNTVTKTAMNSTENTPIQSQDHIEFWTRPIYSGLTFQTKPEGKQRCRNT